MLGGRVFIAVWLWLFVVADAAACPEKCSCKNSSSIRNERVKCGGDEQQISNLGELDFGEDATNVVILDLSRNAISRLVKDDLLNFTELKRLDLSSNGLQEIDSSTFGDALPQLERLKLANNSISHIYQGAFDHLQNLKQLDISSNPLVCDCDLIWLLAWSSAHLMKLQPAPKCEAPSDFKGTLLKKLKVGQDLYCESPLQPLLELIPKKNQVVFEGDELMLKCRAPRVAIGEHRDSEDLPTRAHVFWGWSEKIRHQNSTEDIVYRDPTKVFTDVHLETKPPTDSGILNSILKIASVTKNHTGMWDCTLRSQQANLSQAIVLIVISKSTQYCRAVEVRTNKGVYYWPQTVRGETVQQECVEEGDLTPMASYHCRQDGAWVDLNADSCPFVSETTRILEQFAKVNLTLTKGNTLEIVRRLHNFTQTQAHLGKIRDPMDLEFVARTLVKVLDYVKNQNDIAYLLLDIISQLLMLPHRMFYEAQKLHRSGIKLLNAAEVAAEQASSLMLQQQQAEEGVGKAPFVLALPRNLYISFFNIRLESFAGISCIWLRSDAERNFECSTSNDSFPTFEKYIDAAIQIPISPLFEEPQKSFKLLVAIFRNANLLPHLNVNQSASAANELLTSAVIGTKIVNEQAAEKLPLLSDLSDKISIILRVRPYHNEVSAPVPAWWDSEFNVWNTDVCKTLYMHRGLVMFSCSRLGYYGLLQKTEYLNDFPSENAGALFRFAPLGIYVGCAVLFICSWINIVTFVAFGRAIRINRQQRHSFVNTWLAVSSLCLVFTIGIYQTENYDICKVFGLLMHYFTLCVLLWLCVSLSTMYKRLSKNHRVVTESDMPKDVRLKKPILGVYLVGWGIGMIICGISSAVNISEYASYSFCFLHNASALNAILVPVVILLLFLGILFLCIYYHINQKAVNVLQSHQFSDNTQATENIDLDWLDSTHSGTGRRMAKSNNLEQYRSLTLSNPLSSIVDDFERSNMAHLRAHFLFLLLFAVAWLSAATFVLQEASDVPNSQMFSWVFAISCCLLGFFLLLFYTLSRNDTRNEWQHSSCCCCSRSSGSSRKTYNSVYNVNAPTTNTVLSYKPSYDANNSGSRSNSQCSKHRPGSARSNSHKNERSSRNIDCPTQLLLGAVGQASAPSVIINNNQQQQLASNSNLNSSMSHDIPSAELFYNPNQINVARKFFKKQKRLAKRNNFELQRHMDRFDYPDNMSDVSSLTGAGSHIYSKRHNAMTLLSGGSKVNNTNIHYRPNYNNSSYSYGGSKANPSVIAETGCDAEMMLNPSQNNANAIRNRGGGLNVLANIYTNIPETTAPQHEIIKLGRGPSRSCKVTSQVEPLNEHDELDHESSSAHEEQTPLYENTTASNFFNVQPQRIAASGPLYGGNRTSTPIKEVPAKATEQTLLLEHTDVEAMNSLGLPEPPPPSSITNRLDRSEEETPPELQRDEIYISNSLQITNRIDVDENFPAVLIRFSQTQSKSLNNLNDIFNSTSQHGAAADMQDKLNSATSSNDIPHGSSSSNCHMWLKGTSSLSMREGGSADDEGKHFSNYLANGTSSDKCNSSSGGGGDGGGESSNVYNFPPIRTLSASPTNESDLNYQNSEISIRSHGLYAPQADNELNLTLTDDFPYQSSNASEADDAINDFDEEFGNFGAPLSANDLDAHGQHSDTNEAMNMNTSIDELYEAIKRRSPTGAVNDFGSNCPNAITTTTSLATNTSFLKTENANAENTPSFVMSKVFRENLNDTLEDDSSQSSVISYIDPTKTDKTQIS